MNSSHLAPALVVPFVVWRIYRRVRRNVGRQPLRRKRMIAAVAIFGVLSGLFALASRHYPASLVALAGGLVVGAPLAIVGLRMTRFEQTEEGNFYTPNTYIGLVLTLLLVGRMAYRITAFLLGADANGVPPAAPFQSPLTLFVFGVTAGYYIAYYSGVLRHAPRRAAR